MAKKYVNYRKLAFEHYKKPHVCVVCGFGIPDILEVAHLDGNRENNKISNLALLCPTCHRMHDVGLISSDMILKLRKRPKKVNWLKLQSGGRSFKETKKRQSKAAKKAHLTRKATKRSEAARKAHRTRKRLAAIRTKK